MKGGARPNSGPPPDPTALRRDRPSDKDGWRTLPAECERTAPPWPLKADVSNRARRAVVAQTVEQLEADLLDASPRNRRKLQTAIGELREKITVLDFQIAEQDRIERALWRELWKLPHANAWHELVWVRDIAQYVRHKARAELGSLDDAKEARQWSDRLGLNPAAFMRLRWKVRIESAQLMSLPVAPPPAPAGGSSSRGRLKRTDAPRGSPT